MKRKYIWAYLDGEPLVEVIQAALDNNMTVDDMKSLLIKENPGHEVVFKVKEGRRWLSMRSSESISRLSRRTSGN